MLQIVHYKCSHTCEIIKSSKQGRQKSESEGEKMETTIYESEFFGEKAVGGIFPFQIIIKKSFSNGLWKVETIRREYKPKDNQLVAEDNTLTMSTWREE